MQRRGLGVVSPENFLIFRLKNTRGTLPNVISWLMLPVVVTKYHYSFTSAVNAFQQAPGQLFNEGSWLLARKLESSTRHSWMLLSFGEKTFHHGFLLCDPEAIECNQSRWPFNCTGFNGHWVNQNSSVSMYYTSHKGSCHTLSCTVTDVLTAGTCEPLQKIAPPPPPLDTFSCVLGQCYDCAPAWFHGRPGRYTTNHKKNTKFKTKMLGWTQRPGYIPVDLEACLINSEKVFMSRDELKVRDLASPQNIFWVLSASSEAAHSYIWAKTELANSRQRNWAQMNYLVT